jgi:hypothetical protein
MNLMTNDNTAVTIALHIHDRLPFAPGDLYGIYFNTDSDAATGTDTDSGAPLGAEYAVDIVYGRPWLLLWNGSSFDAVLPQMPIRIGWIDGFGLVLQIGRADLGDPSAFDFAFMTVHGDRDFAPDNGMWSYKLLPFALTASQLSVGSAKAGRPLIAHMKVERSDLGIALQEGAVRCVAKLGGKTLVGRGSFSPERAVCKWRVPRNTGGKRVAGIVSVTFDSATANRSFSVTVA